jgi:hypothetical protein
MPTDKNIYEQLLEEGVPKETLHKVLHTIMLAQIKDKKSPRRFLCRIKKPRLTPLSGFALSLLKTLFIRKPKNPV